MIRLFAITVLVSVVSGPALAHPGHLAGLAGHDHWVAGAAIGIAIAIGLHGALRGKRRDKEQDAKAEPETAAEGQEVEA